jgi:TPR repeat protein
MWWRCRVIGPFGGITVAVALLALSLWYRVIIGVLGAVVSLIALLIEMSAKRHGAQAAELELLRANVRGADARGRLPKVRDARPVQLGVHVAIPLLEEPAAGSPDPVLPSYVRREVDDKVLEGIRAGGLIIAQGPPASGLTRIITEAVKRCHPSWNLIIPANKSASLREIVKVRHRVSKSVIVLDSIGEYVALGGLDAHVLAALCPDGSADIVIVGTYNPKQEDKPLSELLPGATIVHVRQDLSEIEKRQARDAADDPRVAEAFAQRSEPFAQYLASGPAAWNQLQNARDGAQPVGAAIVLATLACRRLGMSRTLNRGDLFKLHGFYLESRVSLADFDEGMQWATHKIIGTAACLKLVGDHEYEPLPYLVKHATELLPQPFPSDAMWKELIPYVQSGDKHLLGVVAFHDGRLGVAEPLLLRRLAIQPSDAQASYLLGRLLCQTGRPGEALSRFEAAARGGIIDAAYRLARLYVDNGERDQAEQWFRLAAYAGHPEAMAERGILRYEDAQFVPPENGQIKPTLRHTAKPGHSSAWEDLTERAQTESMLRHAVKRGHPGARDVLGKLYRETVDVDGLCEIDTVFASETGLPSTAVKGLTPLRDEYEATLRDAVAEGNVSAMNSLGVLCAKTGRTAEARELFSCAAERGNEVAAENLRVLTSVEDENIDASPDTDEKAC